jgi:single-stranded-DNA-specific exonuclease
MKWQLLNSQVPQNQEELSQLLLTNRHLDQADMFFEPIHPVQLTLKSVGIDQDQAKLIVARLFQAKTNQESVLIFGDYDADGVCATAIMWLGLKEFGITAIPFISRREKHGYGISHAALDEILVQTKPDLVITVDNGIVAHSPIARLRDLGVDVIITDHHVPEAELPPANWVFHSTQLCGATVAWMLVKELLLYDQDYSSALAELLDLAGIATIADQVPLRAANRSFAQQGITALGKTQRVGLQELFKVAKIDQTAIDTNTVNFGLAPRINAMGRLEHGMDALRLLCTNNRSTAQALAEKLGNTNLKRQDLTYDMVSAAKLQAASWENEHIIIVHSTEFHEGVIGLIAGRLMEEYYKPAIAMSIKENKIKASARSIAGVNIVELIREVRSDLLEVGGHPMAAGFGLAVEKLEIVSQRLRLLAKEKVAAQLLQPKIDIECLLPLSLTNVKIAQTLQKFEPYGQANPEPIFGWENLQVLDAMTMGREAKHLKLVVADPSHLEESINCIAWNQGNLVNQLQPGVKVNVAGTLNINQWNGKVSLQVMVKDLTINAHS